MKNLSLKHLLVVFGFFVVVLDLQAQQLVDEKEFEPDSLLLAAPQFFLNDNFLPPDIAPEVSSPNAAAG